MAKMTSTARTGWILYRIRSQHYSIEIMKRIKKQVLDLLREIEISLKLPERNETGLEDKLTEDVAEYSRDPLPRPQVSAFLTEHSWRLHYGSGKMG